MGNDASKPPAPVFTPTGGSEREKNQEEGPSGDESLPERSAEGDELQNKTKLVLTDGNTESLSPSPGVAGLKEENGNNEQLQSSGVTSTKDDRKEPSASMTPARSLLLPRVQARIALLVARHSNPVDAGKLSTLYREVFHERLDFKGLGYDRLKPLLESIPSIELRTMDHGPPLLLVPRQSQTVADTLEIPPPTMNLETVQARIELLVSRHSPLDACNLPILYNDEFHEPLDYKAKGHKTMKALLETIPSIELRTMDQGPPLLLMSRETQTVLDTHKTAATTEDLEIVQVRINLLVSYFSPLDVAKLPSLYKKKFRKCLDYKEFGFETMESLLETVPSIELRTMDQGPPLLLMPRETKSAVDTHKTKAITADLKTVQERIKLLVSRHSPLDACNLPILYNDEFHEPLDYKTFGYKKMKSLLETIPSIELKTCNKGPPLLLILHESSTATAQPETPEAFRSFYRWARVNEDNGSDHISTILNHESDSSQATAEETVPSTSVVGEYESSADIDLVKARIKSIVARHSPMDVTKLPKLYEETFQEQLNCLPIMGLKDFLTSIPSVAVGISNDMSRYIAYSTAQLTKQQASGL